MPGLHWSHCTVLANLRGGETISTLFFFAALLIQTCFQCYAAGCLQIWATLSQQQRGLKYCSHLKEAHFALENEQFSAEHLVKLEDLSKLKLSESDMKSLNEASSEGSVRSFSAPGDNLIVPSFSPVTHVAPLPFIHLRKGACPILSCKNKRSKQHSLAKKSEVLCLHSLLGKHQN